MCAVNLVSRYWMLITHQRDSTCWRRATWIRRASRCRPAVQWLAAPSAKTSNRSRYSYRSCATSIRSRRRCGGRPSVCQRWCTAWTASWLLKNWGAVLPSRRTLVVSKENWTSSIAVHHCALDSATSHRLVQNSRKYLYRVLVTISHPTATSWILNK